MQEGRAGSSQCFKIREKEAKVKHTKTDIGQKMLHLFNFCFSFWQDPENTVSVECRKPVRQYPVTPQHSVVLLLRHIQKVYTVSNNYSACRIQSVYTLTLVETTPHYIMLT